MKEINIDKTILKNIAITITSFLATYFIKYAINFEENITYSNSVISLVVFAGLIVLLKKTWTEENIKKIKSTAFLGIMFSTFLVIGNSIETKGTVEYGNIQIYFAIIFLATIIDALLVQLYQIIEKFEERKKDEKKSKLTENQKQLITFLIILICWIPVFLAVYPGYFCYDARDELSFYILEIITTWQPPIHTAILGFIIINVSNIFHDFNIGIAVFIFLQMLIIAGCFTYCISFLRKYNTSKIIRIISILYYALFPTVVMYALCSTKDTIFSALLLINIIFILEALLDKEKFIKSKWKQIKFVVITLLVLILRNNAIYAYIPFFIIFIIIFKNKKVLIPVISVIIMYIVYLVVLNTGWTVHKLFYAEELSVPLQQIARVYNYNYESLSQEELEMIYEYTDDETLKKYVPECADDIKEKVNLKENLGYTKFLKLWASIGIKNIGIYIDSFLENTIGFWYPSTIIDGYVKTIPEWYTTETSYFMAHCELPGRFDSKIPLLKDIYFNISRETDINKIPVISMLFSPGAMVWLLFICIGYSVYKKRKEITVTLSLIVLLWLTLLLGPMVLVRYVLILFFGFPLVFALILNGDKFKTNK